MKNTALFKQQLQKIDSQTSNETNDQVRQVDSGNSRVSDAEAEVKQRNFNIQEPLPRNSNNMPQIIFPIIKCAHARQHIDKDSNQNEPFYDEAQSTQYAQSDNCKRPQSCNAIFQSLLNTNELDPQLILNLPWSTASTPCMNTPRNARYREVVRYVSLLNHPYRTVSHFGFNSPTRLPQPEHKHIPQNAPRSSPLAAACSYEDVYGSPRYVDLCNQCYEQLWRLKPDFIPVRTRLRNLVDMPKSSAAASSQTETTPETLVQTLVYDTPVTVDTAVLETVLEVDENKTSDVSVCADTLKNEEEAPELQLQNSQSQSSFERRISNFNFSKESTNIHYEPPLIADSVLSMEIKSLDEHAIELPEEQTQIVEQSKCKVEILEVIEFGNWMKADGVLDCQYQSSSDTQVVDIKSPTILDNSSDSENSAKMTRDERMGRKKEFQEIWEAHINFFEGKETALLEEVEELKKEENEQENAEKECQIEEVYRSSSEVDVSGAFEKEVFLGCSLIVHNVKTEESIENVTILQTNQMAHQSTPFFAESDTQEPAPYYILPGNNDTLDMGESESDDAKTIDTTKAEEFLSLVDSELSFYRMNFNTTTTSGNENAEDASDEDEYSLNSVEYEILEKIGLNKLKEKAQIFEKIDNTVRNKLTPKKIDDLLKQNSENCIDDDEQPTTSAKAISNLKKFLCNSAANLNEEGEQKEVALKKDAVETEKFNLVSSCSTFSIASNKGEEEEAEEENAKQKYKTSNSSNTSIFSRQLRGKRTKRNFIRENIKNASKPRTSKCVPVKHNENISAIFCPCPFGEVVDQAQPCHKKRKKYESTSSASSMESPLYTFQKQQKESGVQSLWMSMSPAGSSKRKSNSDSSGKSTNSIRRKLFAEKEIRRRRENATACSSSLLKLTPLRGIGLKPIANYPTKRAVVCHKNSQAKLSETKVEVEQSSDKENKEISKENVADSVESQDCHYYTAESLEQANNEEEVVEGAEIKEILIQGMTREELILSCNLDEAAREAVLNDYIQELLDELEEEEE